MKTQCSVSNTARTEPTVTHSLHRDWLNAWLAAALIALIPWQALGLGSRIPNQDAAAIARGNAFVATADNPSAIYYNPAGISQLEGQHAQFGSLFYMNIYADYESPSGKRTKNDPSIIPVPQFQYTVTLKDQPVSFGLGIYAPFGLGMEWPDNAPFRNAGLGVKLTYVTINPVVAWRPIPTLSIALGPTFNYSKAKLRQGIIASPFQFHFEGEDWAYGFDAGILWQPHPKWSFGAKYWSATSLDYDGTARFGPSATFLPPPSRTQTHLEFPQIVSGGVSFRPTTNWNFEVDVDWSDWDTVKNAAIKGIATLPLNWHSSFFYEAGVTRQLGKGYFISAGYFFSEASTSERNYTPLVPDTDLHVGSIGVGRYGQHWSWTVAGQLIGGEFRKVDHSADPSVNGRYRIFTPTLSFSIAYHF